METEVINANVKTTKALTEGVGNDVKVIDHNVRMAKDATDELNRLLLSYTSILDRGVVAARVLEPSRSEILPWSARAELSLPPFFFIRDFSTLIQPLPY